MIGVDLGNDSCVIGMAARGGIDIILNENSNRKNPTLVSGETRRNERGMGGEWLRGPRNNGDETAKNGKNIVAEFLRTARTQAGTNQATPYQKRLTRGGFVYTASDRLLSPVGQREYT